MSHKGKMAFIFPGQGESHSVGMAKDFYDNFLVAKQTFEQASDILGYDLKKLIFEGPLNKLSMTQYCQVAIYTVSSLILRVIQKEFPDFSAQAFAGLSLGEYSAAYAAKILSFEQGVKLVHARGTLMQKACLEHPSTMAVVLGLDEDQVQKIIEGAPCSNELWVANLNCPKQVVVSGTKKAIPLFVEAAKKANVKRVLPLNVAGAFHCPLMQSAADELEKILDNMNLKEPQGLFLMNTNASSPKSVDEIKKQLVLQITHPVRWQASIEQMKENDITTYFEIGCGKVLSGLNKRMGLASQTVSINTVEDLDCIKKHLASSNQT